MFDRAAFVAAAASLCVVAGAQQPQRVPFNTTASAGPDGPWNFITLQVGSGPTSSVDFYPMLSNSISVLISDTVCKNTKSGQCADNTALGYYNSASSSANANPQNVDTTQIPVEKYDAGLADQLSLTGTGHYWLDNVNGDVKADNVGFFVTTDIAQKDGNTTYKPLSLLSLEQNASGHQTKTTKSSNATTSTLLETYTNSTKNASHSFSVHMGSAAFNQSGSLYFGGYDPSRIIEKPAVFPHLGFVRLNTISFGSAAGLNPWQSDSNLPLDFLGAPADIIVSPHVPHIYLAQNVCKLMAQYLPIQYDPDTNLYLWNTTSQQYNDIVSSPSYLNFTFGDSAQTSIRVPFALLNLTMTAPLKDKPTQYFPCSGRPNVWNLGRAFLQSAILMQSYGPDSVYIAQAPGPAINGSVPAPAPSPISAVNPTIAPLANAPSWQQTWNGHLTPLGYVPSTGQGVLPTGAAASGATPNSSQPLSGGAIAGVIIGVFLGTALLGAIVFFTLQHRHRKYEQARASTRLRNRGHISRPSTLHSRVQSQLSTPPGYVPRHTFIPAHTEKILSPTESTLSASSSLRQSPLYPPPLRVPSPRTHEPAHHQLDTDKEFYSPMPAYDPARHDSVELEARPRTAERFELHEEGSRFELPPEAATPRTAGRVELPYDNVRPAEMSSTRFSGGRF